MAIPRNIFDDVMVKSPHPPKLNQDQNAAEFEGHELRLKVQ